MRFAPWASNRLLSVLPEILEPVRRHVGVSNRVHDILLAHVVLEGPGIMHIVGELVAGSAFIGRDSHSLNMLHCTEVS